MPTRQNTLFWSRHLANNILTKYFLLNFWKVYTHLSKKFVNLHPVKISTYDENNNRRHTHCGKQ